MAEATPGILAWENQTEEPSGPTVHKSQESDLAGGLLI